MGQAPETYRIQHVVEENKVTFEGESQAFDVIPKGQELSAGQELRGWLNPAGKHGPYFKIAEERQRSNGAAPRSGGGDPQRSARIERQHSQEMALRWFAMPKDLRPAYEHGELTLRALIDWFCDDLNNASARSGDSPHPAGPPSAAEAPDAPKENGQGAVQPTGVGGGDGDIPF